MAAKFKVLLWKNFKTEKRMWLLFIFEIFFIFLFGLLIIASPTRTQSGVSSISKREMLSVRVYAEDSLSNIDIIKNIYGEKPFPNKLIYAPELPYAKDIMTKVAEKLGLDATSANDSRDCFAKITFPNHTGSSVPKKFSLQISFPGKFRTFHSEKVYSNFWLSRCTGSLTLSLEDSPHDMQTDLYIREGFLQLQHLIFSEWLSKLETRIPDVDVTVQSFRYDTSKRLCLPTQSPNSLTLFYYFMFFLPFLNMVWKFGREREENMVVHHWHYGCSSFLYWFSHFISSFIHFLILDIFVLLLVVTSWQAKDPMQYEDNLSILYFFLLLILTASELIIAAMVIVTLVPRSINAVYFAIMLWLLLYASFATVLEYSVEVKTFWMIFSLVIMFNNDFTYGTRFLSTLDESTANDVKFLLLTTIGSILLKLLILVIVMHFRPGCYVERRPLSIQCKRKKTSSGGKISKHDFKVLFQEGYQSEPIGGDRTIVVLHVSRSLSRFRQPTRRVLRDVNLAMYKGEITVILGHGSCGKTTLATLLAGWNTPDKGTIAYFGHDINYKRELTRMSDIRMPDGGIFDYLTAFETLTYFVHIKRGTRDHGQLQDEFSKWHKTIRTVFRYGDDLVRLGKDMTYEQKRILSLSCVLCCDTKIIILDEPTANMRQSTHPIFWNILKREKAERSIIVMTNSIREAEAIGDRVAVFVDRTPKAYGTLMYLKTTFDTGFDLIILKDKLASSGNITSFLKTIIDDIELDSRNQQQLIYKISTHRRSHFQQLLIELQKRYDELGIIDARLLTSNLNDVFFALGVNKAKVNIPKEPEALRIDYLPKKKRCCQQWSAMFFKKMKHHPSMIIPLIMCIVSIFLISIFIQLLVVLRDRGDLQQFSKMTIGFDKNSNHDILSNLDKCKFVGIQNVKMGVTDGRDRSHSFTFTDRSFFCSKKKNFTQYIKSTNEWHHLYGALESNGHSSIHKIHVNQHILHSAPLVLNLLHNMILRNYLINDTVVKLISDPVRVPSPHATGLLNTELEHLFVPLAIGIVLPITLCSFIIDLVDERKSNSFMLMTIAGLRIDIYWLANFIWDYLTFVTYSIIFQIILIAWYFEDIRFSDSFLMFLIMNLYSFPLLASIYFAATITKSPPYRAFLIACVIHIASGLFAFVIYWDVLLAHVSYLYGLLILPTFAMLDGISNVYVMSNFLKTCHENCAKADFCDINNICNSMPECCAYSFFEWGNSGIIRSITFLLITTLIFILLLFWVEIRNRESKFLITPKIKDMYSKISPDDDEDVAQMRERIASTELHDMSKKRVVVDQVERSIPKDSMVLRTISFDVEKSSCVAIFGANHSGKSHLCRQIIGQDSFRFGDIYVCGIPIKYNMHDAWVHMGYVPQVRGLLHEFEVIEILNFFCLIRGVPRNAIQTVVMDVVSLFGLSGVKKYRIDELTMGQQRKVSIAVALMATNEVLILDEPTAGLPEYNAREIWKVLRYLISTGKAIVLTTRNMSECDALSDAVLLIDDQDMLGYGNSQHLRRKLVGVHISVKLRREGTNEEDIDENLRIDVDNLQLFMLFMHGDAILINRVDNFLQFYLPIEDVNYAMLYGSMEKNRERLNIADYSINQGNLDELLQKKR